MADAVDRFLADPGLPFTVPGHKRSPQFGDSLLALDLPLYGGADDLRCRAGTCSALSSWPPTCGVPITPDSR